MKIWQVHKGNVSLLMTLTRTVQSMFNRGIRFKILVKADPRPNIPSQTNVGECKFYATTNSLSRRGNDMGLVCCHNMLHGLVAPPCKI